MTPPDDQRGFLDLPAEFTDPRTARVRVIPVPYDKTSTWAKGADRGPRAILEASGAVEWYDIETDSEPHLAGIATDPPIETDDPPEAMTDLVDRAVGAALDAGQLPVVLGGEHSVSIGAIRAAADRIPGLCVLQIDAHADLRESYHGSTHNHACVMARARERCPIVQVGIRSMDRAELDSMDRDRVLFAHDIRHQDPDEWAPRAASMLADDLYVTIDLDAFDPALVPATGTPEPGGLSWHDVNTLLKHALAGRRLVGFDVVELCPHPGHHASEFLAAKLVHRVLAEALA